MYSISRTLSAAIVVTLMVSISACADSNTFQRAVIGPMAVECGMDAGFGRGTKGRHVAIFIVKKMRDGG